MTYPLITCALAAALVVGYVVGRVRPALRLANWAAWKAYGSARGPAGVSRGS